MEGRKNNKHETTMTEKEFSSLPSYPRKQYVMWGYKKMKITSVDHRAKVVYLTPIDRKVFRPYPAEYQRVELIKK